MRSRFGNAVKGVRPWVLCTGGIVALLTVQSLSAQQPEKAAEGGSQLPTALATTSPVQESLASMIQQYAADQRTLSQRFRIPMDPIGKQFRENMLQSWRDRLAKIDFDKLDRDQQIDWLLLNTQVQHAAELAHRREVRMNEAEALVPYAQEVIKICSAREHGFQRRAEDIAASLDSIASQATELTKGLNSSKRDSSDTEVKPTTGLQASDLIDQMLRQLQDANNYYEGYDPQYAWWATKPYESAKQALTNHRKAVREKVAGLNENDPDKIVGLPIGEAGLAEDLRHAWIAYTPAELIAIGEQEMEWCDARFREAADELKVDGDWRKALELVKSLHVEPGDQPKLIRELAWESIRFLESHDLITIPDMAKHGWRIDMMSAAAQRVNPYFLGGDNIIVAFPTNTMTHSEKLMSLKSNNIHFCRATVHHELIPGHHLQTYSLARYKNYRDLFDSPFWMEGWALYWEMLLWDLDFAQSAEDRVGMLFWRRHRAARIIFSLNYQSGKWTAEECVKYLIDRVGHEPSAAAAEVRRSIMGGYGPLYQAGYMLGGLQLRALHKEIVQSGKMTNRDFHDAILRENFLPIELLRAKFLDQKLTRESTPSWKFYEFKK